MSLRAGRGAVAGRITTAMANPASDQPITRSAIIPTVYGRGNAIQFHDARCPTSAANRPDVPPHVRAANVRRAPGRGVRLHGRHDQPGPRGTKISGGRGGPGGIQLFQTPV